MIAPYYQRGAVTLYQGDCRAVLRENALGPFALLLTDPPYGIKVESDQFSHTCKFAIKFRNYFSNGFCCSSR